MANPNVNHESQINCNETDDNVTPESSRLDKSIIVQTIVQPNSVSETTNPTDTESAAESSENDEPTTLLKKKKKKLTKLREKEIDFTDSSSYSDIDSPPQNTYAARHRRKKISKTIDDDQSDNEVQSLTKFQDMRNSCDTTQEYIDNLLSYLKYNIKYVTNEKLKKELNDKMLSLEMEHKRKQNDLEEGS